MLTQTPHDVQKPNESRELQVNPPITVPGLIFGSLSSISDKQVGIPNGPGDKQPYATPMVNEDFNDKPDTGLLPTLSENGGVHNSHHWSHEDQKTVNGSSFAALHVSDNNIEVDGKSISESVRNEGVKVNGTFNGSSVHAHHKVAHPKADVPVLDARDILPRGLINSGNLCFLNSTLQALLACSPLVQLLQRLRTRNIPKVWCCSNFFL